MGHYPCPECCGGTVCLVYADNFDRGDTTTIPDTTELVGNWANTSNALHPDHAASDQRLRFDKASSDADVLVVAKIDDGQTGDRVGVAILMDADGDSFVEATLRWGSGTNGRLNMNRFDNGSTTWTTNAGASPACGLNEYDLPAGTAYWLCLFHKAVDGGSLWQYRVYADVYSSGNEPDSLGTPRVLHEVEYFEASASVPSSLYGGLVTGTDAITATFRQFAFYHAYAPCDCVQVNDDPMLRGEPCDYPGAVYDEEVGDWDLEEIDGFTDVVTSSEPATLLVRNVLRSPSAHWASFAWWSRTGDGSMTLRYVWDYEDVDNYWAIEFVYDNATMGCSNEVRILQRSGGTDTTKEELTGMANFPSWALGGALVIVDNAGYVAVNFGLDMCAPTCAATWLCGGPYTFTGTGRIGFRVIDAPDGVALYWLGVRDGVGACEVSAVCETCVDGPVVPDPEPIGCCTDIDDLAVGDAIEVTLDGINYFLIAPCPGACGDSDFITDLNATHTLTITYKSDVHMIAYVDTGLTTDCNGLDVSAKIWLRITNIGGGQCEARGAVIFGENVCTILFKSSAFTEESVCEGLVLDEDGTLNASLGLEPRNCCLQADDATMTVGVP